MDSDNHRLERVGESEHDHLPGGQSGGAISMRVDVTEPWPTTEEAALAEQRRLLPRLRTTADSADLLGTVRAVAGLDVSYAKDSDRLVAAAVLLDVDELTPVEEHVVAGMARFPYIPGLLAFREVPTLVEALRKLTQSPDVLFCDGYGIAHPRGFGLACHLGVLTGLPSVGVAKTPFVGSYTEPGPLRGDHSELIYEGRVVGSVLRTQPGIKPVFVSVGHAIDLATARELTLRLAPRYRLPETTRAADHLSRMALASES